MCQPKSKGGRRCAAHHPATLALKTEIESRSLLQKGQIDFAFKALMKEGRDSSAPTKEEYQRFLLRERTAVSHHSMDPKKRDAVLRRIDRALEEDQIPNGPHFHALKNIEERSKAQWIKIADAMVAYGQAKGMTKEEAFDKFNELYQQTVADRDADYSQLLDSRTQRAIEMLNKEAQPVFEETPRIQREPVDNHLITSQGYDPADGRLEVEIADEGVYSLHSVSQEDYQRFLQSPIQTFNELRQDVSHQYESAEEARQDAYRIWCDKCKEFKLASGHACQDGTQGRQVVGRNLDEIYNRIRTQSLNSSLYNTRFEPAPQPEWAKPIEDREQYTPDASAYGTEQGSASRGRTTHAQRITVNNLEDGIEAIRQGKVVTYNIGRKIPIAGTNHTQFYEATVPVSVHTTNGSYLVSTTADTSNAKCTCDAYRVNGRCPHLYPHDDNDEMNYLLRSDIAQSLRSLQSNLGTHGFSLTHGGPSERFHFQLDEHNQISEEDLNNIAYVMEHNENPLINLYRPNSPYSVALVNTGADQTSVNVLNNYLNDQEFSNLRGAIQTRMESSDFATTRIANRAEEVLNSAWEISPSRNEYLDRFNQNSERYVNNPDKFVEDYKEALSHAHQPINFVEGPVTGGYLSTDDEGPNPRGFGIEIEFDDADMDEVAEALSAAGLADQNYVSGYHDDNSYNSWRVEDDCSVSGEIVSPVLFDNAESWAQVRKVCDIAKSLGARATVRTGNHVHIGTEDMTVAQQKGVLTAVVANQDVIRRIATNPERQQHRTNQGSSYSSPFSDSDIDSAYRSNRGPHLDRYKIANFYTGHDTIEFRDADGTLDPGHIQAQVMMSAALTAAGERGAWNDLTANTVRKQKVGANATRQPYIDRTIEDEDDKIIASNVALMTTLDALFPDAESKKKILDVAVRNPWQAPQNYSY